MSRGLVKSNPLIQALTAVKYEEKDASGTKTTKQLTDTEALNLFKSLAKDTISTEESLSKVKRHRNRADKQILYYTDKAAYLKELRDTNQSLRQAVDKCYQTFMSTVKASDILDYDTQKEVNKKFGETLEQFIQATITEIYPLVFEKPSDSGKKISTTEAIEK